MRGVASPLLVVDDYRQTGHDIGLLLVEDFFRKSNLRRLIIQEALQRPSVAILSLPILKPGSKRL